MRIRQFLFVLTLSLGLAACGDEVPAGVLTPDSVAAASDAPNPEDDPSEPAPVAEVPENSYDLEFVLPGLPDDLDAPQPVASVGEPVDLARIDTEQTLLWCAERDGDTYATAVIGDAWETEQGSGIIIEIDATVEPGTYTFPSQHGKIQFFLLDRHGDTGIPSEYASTEEESTGSITIESIPCGEFEDGLALSVDGSLGAETNPGFIAAAQVTGSLQLVDLGDAPEWWLTE